MEQDAASFPERLLTASPHRDRGCARHPLRRRGGGFCQTAGRPAPVPDSVSVWTGWTERYEGFPPRQRMWRFPRSPQSTAVVPMSYSASVQSFRYGNNDTIK